MSHAPHPTLWVAMAVLALPFCCGSCGRKTDDGLDEKIAKLGSVEVTAKLVEVVPFDAKCTFPANDLYDYVYVFKYRVLDTHRGKVDGDSILIGHYNPLKPRAGAADARAEGVGGNLKKIRAGDVHRMALEVPWDEYCMAPLINKYHGKIKAPIYWAVWTNRVTR